MYPGMMSGMMQMPGNMQNLGDKEENRKEH